MCIRDSVYRVLLGLDQQWNWVMELIKAVANLLIAMVLFPFLDRLQVRD